MSESVFDEKGYRIGRSIKSHKCWKLGGFVLSADDEATKMIGWKCSLCDKTWQFHVRDIKRALGIMDVAIKGIAVIENEC